MTPGPYDPQITPKVNTDDNSLGIFDDLGPIFEGILFWAELALTNTLIIYVSIILSQISNF